jgi:hypothetical protein
LGELAVSLVGCFVCSFVGFGLVRFGLVVLGWFDLVPLLVGLVGLFAGWLVGWMVGCLLAWLVASFLDWLVGRSFGSF